MDKADKQFFLTFLGVTGALVFITIVVFVAAKLVGSGPEEKSAAQLKMAEERLQPIGKLNLQSSPTQPAAPFEDLREPIAEPFLAEWLLRDHAWGTHP